MGNKHIKIEEGHSLDEWNKKYQKKIAKGKLKVYDNETELPTYSKFWKIGGKFYTVPTAFEWYNQSLRKSVGLTTGLTVTSILATFFLVAALIQSQVKWKADKYGLSVSFYAGDGEFVEDGKITKSKVITGINKGTKLKDIPQIKNLIPVPTPSDPDYEFGDWVVDDGVETTVYTEETEITSNVSLKAKFDFKPNDPVAFNTDSWETVYKVIEQGKDVFIDTYCKSFPDYTPDKTDTVKREKCLFEFLDSPTNWKIVEIGNVGEYGVRIIGIGQDQQSGNDDKKVDREMFTFEFNECIMQLPYSFEQGGSPYYTKSGSSEPEETKYEYCALKTYTEDIVKSQLPSYILRKMKTVNKRTIQVKGGIQANYNDKLQSWQIDRKCYENLEVAETDETLFSLSLDEIGATKIPFTYSSENDGIEFMKETTQQNEDVMGTANLPIGEGFYNSETKNYTGEYLFYSQDWLNPDDHNYPNKRSKKYFIGEDEEGVEAGYRLRSIYLPNEYDADDTEKSRTSGNKDYSPFETWNIVENGNIGNLKISGKSYKGEDGNDHRYYFAAGDMAWTSMFVAPAFCL